MRGGLSVLGRIEKTSFEVSCIGNLSLFSHQNQGDSRMKGQWKINEEGMYCIACND